MPSNLKHLSGYVSVYDSKYVASKRKREEVINTKYWVVNEGDIFLSITESREITISRVVEELMPEEGGPEMSYRTIDS